MRYLFFVEKETKSYNPYNLVFICPSPILFILYFGREGICGRASPGPAALAFCADLSKTSHIYSSPDSEIRTDMCMYIIILSVFNYLLFVHLRGQSPAHGEWERHGPSRQICASVMLLPLKLHDDQGHKILRSRPVLTGIIAYTWWLSCRYRALTDLSFHPPFFMGLGYSSKSGRVPPQSQHHSLACSKLLQYTRERGGENSHSVTCCIVSQRKNWFYTAAHTVPS